MAKKPLPKKTRKPAAPAKAPKSSKKSPAAYEAEIRRLDREILSLINRRASLTTEVIQSQTDLKQAVFAPLADDTFLTALETATQSADRRRVLGNGLSMASSTDCIAAGKVRSSRCCRFGFAPLRPAEFVVIKIQRRIG